MKKPRDVPAILSAAFASKRPFVIICDLGGGKIETFGSCTKEWLDEVLTAVLAGARGSPGDPLERSDKIITVHDALEN